MEHKRRHFTPEEKVAVLRRHLLDKVPVSDLCDELGLQPNQFYLWQKAFFENGAAAFAGKTDSRSQKREVELQALRSKLARKDEVIAEIMASHIELKKSLGEI
ncbi:MAG: transposase [Planctomycetes bacterium]|nr:transposase [Planctomycetota bacterium]